MIGTILLCQVWAPVMLMNIPKLYRNLKVCRIEDVPAGEHVYTHDDQDLVDAGIISQEDHDAKYDWPHHTIIHMMYGSGHTLRITVNNDTQEVLGWHDSNSHYGGSGDIGVLLIGLPGVLVALPLIFLSWFIRWTIKRISGKETRNLIVWNKLKGQLSSELAKELEIALSKGN